MACFVKRKYGALLVLLMLNLIMPSPVATKSSLQRTRLTNVINWAFAFWINKTDTTFCNKYVNPWLRWNRMFLDLPEVSNV